MFKYGLVIFIWGNVLEIDCECGVLVIKLSGVEYDVMCVEDMVIVDFMGKVVEGKLNLLSDIVIYIEFYCVFFDIGGVVYIYLCSVMIWV